LHDGHLRVLLGKLFEEEEDVDEAAAAGVFI
jgi:hypothetical protein